MVLLLYTFHTVGGRAKRYSQLLFNICHEVLRTGKRGRPTKVLPKGMVVRLKNKSSKRRDSEGKLKKVETPKPEHPETIEKPEEKDVHANHVEAFNSAIRRYLGLAEKVKKRKKCGLGKYGLKKHR